MTKEQIEYKLQVEERKRERDKAIRDVLDTYLVAAAEQFRIVANEPTIENGRRLITEIDCLRDFINETMMNVHKAYGCTVPLIEDDWSKVEHMSTQKMRKRAVENAILHASEEYTKLLETYNTLIKKNRIEERELQNERNEFYRNRDAWRMNMPHPYQERYTALYESQNKLYDLSYKLKELKTQLLNPVAAVAVATE